MNKRQILTDELMHHIKDAIQGYNKTFNKYPSPYSLIEVFNIKSKDARFILNQFNKGAIHE